MQKIDMKKAEPALYRAPRGKSVIVDVPAGQFLMVDGIGSPEGGGAPAFQRAIQALYGVAYTLKFSIKKREPEHDFVLPPLEALWWWGGAGSVATAEEKDWHWTLMLRVPDFVTPRDVDHAIHAAAEKRPDAPIEKLRLERYKEGRAMQTMHVGPYKDELATIERLHDEMRQSGYVMAGKHHEIYLGDPRRAKPERLRTIVRQPVKWTDEGAE